MKKVLVTGANGQLGRTFQKYSREFEEINFKFCDSSELDITKKHEIENIFKIENPDYCINCAAFTNVEKAESKPYLAYMVNSEAVKNIAIECAKHDTTLLHISTDYVFNGKQRHPYTIHDKPDPINEYGRSKLHGEKYIQDLMKRFYIVRTSWLYSKEFGENFYRTILAKAMNEKEIQVVDNQIGCPTNTVNLSAFLISLIQKDNNDYGIFHFCDSEPMTWWEFANKILFDNNIKGIHVGKNNNFITKAERPKYSILK